MASSTTGITFTETMEGPFALGETDPAAGARRGTATPLSMHATITIRDVERFITDPQHQADLAGKLDFAPFGQAIPADRGVFKLFAPSEDRRMKLMVYQMAFRHGGERYYLAGRKEVRNDPGIDLWPDTTTLYTHLHRGDDTSGAVAGAGILRIDATAFAKVLATVRPIDAPSAAEGARMVARFGQFFAGELWDTYGPKLK